MLRYLVTLILRYVMQDYIQVISCYIVLRYNIMYPFITLLYKYISCYAIMLC